MSWVNNNSNLQALKQLLQFQDWDGSPLYVYHSESLRARGRAMLQELAEISPYYAMKANCYLPLLQEVRRLGFGVDTVSLGEISRALQAGFLAKQVIFSGVGKSAKEIRSAIRLKIKQINIESLPELYRVAQIAKEEQIVTPVALRVNPDIAVDTHPYIATGFKENKFGIEVQQLEECLSLLRGTQWLEFQGFTLHIGSQLHDITSFADSFSKLRELVMTWQAQGMQFQSLDVGGGLGIYYDADREIEEMLLLRAWGKQVREHLGDLNIPILCEPGRFLVAHCGVLLASVEYVKRTAHKNFVILNTGMHHLIRPALYQAKHRIVLPELLQRRSLQDFGHEFYDVVGPICESADVFAKNIELPQMFPGDTVAILDSGAYGAVMASNYNLRDVAEEILL